MTMDLCTDAVAPRERSRPDFALSMAELEVHLERAAILLPSQRENARLKALDLFEERLVWKSVPFRLLMEFNRRCNVKCVHCGIKRKGTGEFSVQRFERVLDEIGWGVWEVMPLVGGEPTLAPVHEIAPLLRARRIYLNFITNGILFDRSYYEPIADVTGRVQFSFHSHHKEIFERVMPTSDFDQVVQNVRDSIEISEATGAHVVPCIVVMDEVLDTLPEYVDFVADLGVKRIIFQKLYPHTRELRAHDPWHLRDHGEVDELLARVIERANERDVYVETNLRQLFQHPLNHRPTPSPFDILQDNVGIVDLFHPGFCMSTATQATIEWDGTVLPCIKDHISLGTYESSDFDGLWNGAEMRSLRDSFFKRELRPNCRLCWDFYLEHP